MKASALTKFLNLLLEESDYRKTGYFAEKLMVSNKTISNYITELRWYMREYGLDITAKHGVGIRMEGDRNALVKLQKSMQQEMQETFPGMEIHMDPLSLSVACHIGYGSLAIACSKKVTA